MKTYDILSKIVEVNNGIITHFLFRFYKNLERPVWVLDTDILYEWFDIKNINNIESFIQNHEKDGWVAGLTNIVMTGTGMQYLLMLDYSATISKETENEICTKLSVFNKSGDVSYKLDGYLIQTNNSYHYIGKYITTYENFTNFLGSALLFRHADQDVFIVDDRWLGHSLKKRFATIRVGKKDDIYPRIIKEI